MHLPRLPSRRQRKPTVLIFISSLLLLNLVIVLGGCKKGAPIPSATPTQLVATPTEAAQSLPPALVETDPLPDSQITLKNPITFYFNQPMQRASVEAAMTGQPALSGRFAWRDDSTFTFTPSSALQPDTSQTINISTAAQSATGVALQQPISLSYSTGSYLSLVQSLPADGSLDVAPTSAVVAAFNQPVVALGADPTSLPVGFTISPAANGKGEWINTSTYIFYPQPGLSGGASYQVKINPDLTSTAGSPLKSAPSWSFRTIIPRLVSTLPADHAEQVLPDANVQLNFSYSMNAASVEENFSLLTSEGTTVSGQSAWNEDFITFTYTPTALLQRDASYSVLLGAQAAALGGTPLRVQTSLTWHTVPELSISGSDPTEGGIIEENMDVSLFLSSIVNEEQMRKHVTINPSVTELNPMMDEKEMTFYFYSSWEPETDYTITISPDLTDLWGSRLGQTYTLHFRTAPLAPSVEFPWLSSYIADATFLTTQDKGFLGLVTNLSSIPLSIGTMTIDDLVQMYGDDSDSFRETFKPGEAESWTFHTSVPPNRATAVTIPVSKDGHPRLPGLYFLKVNLSDYQSRYNTKILAISHYHVTLKLSPAGAFVWAVDLDTNTPAADLPVTIYNRWGSVIASGTTDSNGVFQGPLIASRDEYGYSFAILGQPGQDNFGLAFVNWDDGIDPWRFDLLTDYFPSNTSTYVYTDRPIYRPGDTVHFRLVTRQVSNGRYTLPEMSSYRLLLHDPEELQIASYDLPLSAFGTAHGEYTLPSNAQSGTYDLEDPDRRLYFYFKVADYRKPEINLQLAFQSTDVISGTALVADINARYFFDAPAGNLPVHWVLYAANSYFRLPNYQVGPVDTSWLMVYNYNLVPSGYGMIVAQGDTRTDANGLARLSIPPRPSAGRQKYRIEVTLTDETGLPISARSAIFVNPAEYYIGVHPDSWSYQAEAMAGFAVQVADWNGDPAGTRTLSAKFQRVEWVRRDPPPTQWGFAYPSYTAVYTPIASTTLTTNTDGTARLTFTPPEPGAYQLDVSGDSALTQVIIWVRGAGHTVWPSLPSQRIRMVADKDAYKPGDTAQVFVPNPFSSAALGLLTVERGLIMRYQTVHLEPGGSTIPIALSNEDAPNIYIAVTLLGQDDQGNPDFRQGYINLPVDVSFEYLQVSLTSQPSRAGPGEPVTFSMRITDNSGNPVEGEFSLSVVDLAVLSLAKPNAQDIFTAFYGQQLLNVQTSLSLAASGQRLRYGPFGAGGREEEFGLSVTRQNFPDTAYWDAQIVTDANGEATVSMNLPDSLTTWQVLVRGLTRDTLVGETQLEVITTKDLLIRPVTPRFMVAGDHALLAAVVQNNTPNELHGTTSLQTTGFQLDDRNHATQEVTVAPNGRARVEWWGTADNVASVSLRFSVQANGLQDAVLVAKGALPVLRYTAPQTFATSGSMAEAGQRLELVSLPVTFAANSGSLDVELNPSLAAAILDSLRALDNYPYDSADGIMSRFLPNLVTYTTLQSFSIDSPELKARLDQSLNQALQHLLTLQNPDGGWGWWQGDESDAYITAYVLFGLAKAKEAGFNVPTSVINSAKSFVYNDLLVPGSTTPAWKLDRMAFELFAMKSSGSVIQAYVNNLYNVRDQLSPWAKALMILSFGSASSSSEQVNILISDLQSTAIRSATGVHWEAHHPDWRIMTSTLSNSAIVLYTLAQVEHSSTLLPDAVNYLMSNRQPNGCWRSSYESAWILLALDEIMKGSGELRSNYAFSAGLNGTRIAAGEAGADTQLNPVTATVPISSLYPHDPNALVIQRQSGTGQLYYTAAMDVYRPAEEVASLDRGINVSRAYYPFGSDLKTTAPVNATKVGDMLTVRLTIVVASDAYHFVVEDYIPAGTEILNRSLQTSQLGVTGDPGLLYDPRNPYSRGWGWWLFNPAQIYDDHITWTASYLPAGTYQLTYTLTILQAGEYQLLPAHAWMLYFPEVQGNSAGGILEIKP